MSEETTEIAVATPETKDAGGLYPGLRMDDVYRFCATVAGSQLVAAKSPEQAMVIVLAGREYGLSPMAALMNCHLIKGKFSMSADMMAAVANRKGAIIELIETDAKKATYSFAGGGRAKPIKFSFTIDDAKRAGMYRDDLKAGDNWRAHTKAMLRARALSQGIRAAYPGMMSGAYLRDELEPEVVQVVSASTIVEQVRESVNADRVRGDRMPESSEVAQDLGGMP
ncbi:MAG: hypothetical protein HRU00_13205 [Myxococcales bacterium]|nr:hypothetical protein [Myxococcales bacterium]